MTMMGVSGWMFLLVPAHPGCPRQKPQSHKMAVCCVSGLCHYPLIHTLTLMLTIVFLRSYPVHFSTSHYNCPGFDCRDFDCPDFVRTPLYAHLSICVDNDVFVVHRWVVMSLQYSRSLLRVVIAQLCQQLGWNAIHPSPLELLTSILERYIVQLGCQTHRFSELCTYTNTPAVFMLCTASMPNKTAVLFGRIRYFSATCFHI